MFTSLSLAAPKASYDLLRDCHLVQPFLLPFSLFLLAHTVHISMQRGSAMSVPNHS